MYARTQPANLDKGGSLSIQSELKKKKQEGLIIESPGKLYQHTSTDFISLFEVSPCLQKRLPAQHWEVAALVAQKPPPHRCHPRPSDQKPGTDGIPPISLKMCDVFSWLWTWMVWFANFWIVLGSRICTFAGPNPWGKSQTHSWNPNFSWGRFICFMFYMFLKNSKITWYTQVRPNFRHLWSWPCTRHSRDDFGCWTSKIGCQLFHTDPCSIGVKVLVTKKLDL